MSSLILKLQHKKKKRNCPFETASTACVHGESQRAENPNACMHEESQRTETTEISALLYISRKLCI